MIIRLGTLRGPLVLLLAVLCSPAHAYFIESGDPAKRLRISNTAPETIQQIGTPLFEFAPFKASASQRVPQFADPLGMGLDPSLKLYSGVVYNVDLLGNFQGLKVKDNRDLELPLGIVRQNTLMTNYVERFFGGKMRAADGSLIRLNNAGKRTWMGLPTTRETSPLTLAGFGSVGEFMRPTQRNWLECEGVERRIYMMKKVPVNLRNKFPPPPNLCYDI